MSRYSRKLTTAAEAAWDAKVNDNFANTFDRPLPIRIEAGTLSALETAFPAASHDQCLAITDYDGTAANGKMFAFSDGVAWHHFNNWQMTNRFTPVGKTGAFTTADNEDFYLLTGASTYAMTLQAVAATNKGRIIWVKFNGTGVVTVTPTGGDTIDGAATHVVAGSANGMFAYISDGGTDWHKVVLMTEATSVTVPIIIAVGDEVSAITTGTAKTTFRMPAAYTLTGIKASLTTASSVGVVTVDVNETGSTIMTTNKLNFDATENTTETYSGTAAALTDTALAADAEITIDIDSAGSSADATGLKVTLIGFLT